MKNMATELGIILIGYFTLVPAIQVPVFDKHPPPAHRSQTQCPMAHKHPPFSFQEFCLFAVVGLVSDFFLQMLFFTTVLSIDIRRMEVRGLC